VEVRLSGQSSAVSASVVSAGEHPIVVADSPAVLTLHVAPCGEDLDVGGVEVEGASAGAGRGGLDDDLAVEELHVRGHGKALARQVDGAPAQAEDLTAAHPGER
jgi:hypothetical protein